MPATSSKDRHFLVGETVHIRARISLPGTRTPVDPATVTLVSIEKDGTPVVVDPTLFTRAAEGDFTLVIETETLEAGTYAIVVRVEDGPEKVVLLTDKFVLRPV